MESPPVTLSAPAREDLLQKIRTWSLQELEDFRARVLPAEDALPRFLNTLGIDERTTALRACLICWAATLDHLIPREMQLRVLLADRQRRFSLVSAGTGSGKTLPMAINILLDDPRENSITLTLSPLKRLQTTQEEYFADKLQIRTLVVNEDTVSDELWWRKNIIADQELPNNPIRHLIVTVEQLERNSAGHFPRLGGWMRNHKHFQQLVTRINVDEAHFIYTAGTPLYGTSAFRPAFGQLEHLKRLLPARIVWHFFSATLPPHITSHIRSRLLVGCDYVDIHASSNRPNIMYATHTVVGQLDELRNYECFLTAPFDLDTQPHIIIFADDKSLTTRITRHLRACLPAAHRDKGIVRYYHSVMSQEYLESTHEAFVSPSGSCRILVATSGQSVGVDFPNVEIVCNVGLPSNIVDTLQRAGRAIRNSHAGSKSGLFVLFCEAWSRDVDIGEYELNAEKFGHDPDRPRAELHEHSKRQERAPLSLIKLVQSKTCLRKLFAEYLGDKSPSSLEFTSPFCCDSHEDQVPRFCLQDYLPGSIFSAPTTGTKRKDPPRRNTYRKKQDRKALDLLLIEWVLKVVDNDDLLMRESIDILSKDQRKRLVCMRPQDITSRHDIVRALDETDEWGEEFSGEIFSLVREYDMSLAAEKGSRRRTVNNSSTAPARKPSHPGHHQAEARQFQILTPADFGGPEENSSCDEEPSEELGGLVSRSVRPRV